MVVLGLIFWPLERWLGPVRQSLWQRKRISDVLYWFLTPWVSRAVIIAGFSGIVIVIAKYTQLPSDLWAFVAELRKHSPIASLPKWSQLLIALLVGDFFQYWVHRLFHTRRLWATHSVHHSPTELDWLSSVRTHPLNDIPNKLSMALPLVVLGVDLQVFAAALPFLQLITILEHSNLPFDYGPMRFVINSPRYHRWHHSKEAAALDKNFAGMFPIWDLLFGTFYLPRRVDPLALGIEGNPVPNSFVGQIAYPFLYNSFTIDIHKPNETDRNRLLSA